MKYLTKPMLGTQLDFAHPLNKGLVGFWLFNEGNGNKIQDLSMNGNTGALNNMAFPPTPASGWNPGRTGTTLSFDGVDDCVDAGSSASLQNSVFTYIAWVKPIGIGIEADTIVGGSAQTGFPQLRILDTNQLDFLKQGIVQLGQSTGTVTIGSWNFVALTHDASKNYVFYINGIPSGNGAQIQSFTFSNLYIGKRYTEEVFNGSIDEVRIWNRALSAAEIKQLYINSYGMFK